MKFRILVGNHAWQAFDVIADMVLHLKYGLEEAGHTCEVDTDTLSTGHVTIVLEHFYTDKVLQQFTDFTNHGGKLGVIFTETITGQTLNQFSDNQKATFKIGDEHDKKISEQAYWSARYEKFHAIAPKTQFIWSLVKDNVNPLKLLAEHERVFFLPFGYTKKFRTIEHIPIKSRDFDFSFFGRLTPYRYELIKKLEKWKLKITHTPMMLPRYIRDDLLGRTRINLWMRMSPEWGMTSTHRASHLLNNHAYHAYEAADPTHIDKYIARFPSGQFVESCVEAISSPRFYEQQEAFIDSYRDEQAMPPMIERLIASSFPE